MSNDGRTKYDLLDDTERNTRYAADSAAFAAGATAVNALQTARLGNLQEESNNLQRKTHDLQLETQRLQEKANAESQETRRQLTELGYDLNRFSQAYEANEDASRRQREKAANAICEQIQQASDRASRDTDRSIKHSDELTALNLMVDFRGYWLQTANGKFYRNWLNECRQTIPRMLEHHEKMIKAREKDRERLIAQTFIDEKIPSEPVLVPEESFFTEKEPSLDAPPRPHIEPEVQKPVSRPRPLPCQWGKLYHHLDISNSKMPRAVVKVSVLACIVLTIVFFALWGFKGEHHYGVFAFVAYAGDAIWWLLSLIMCFLVSAVLSLAIGGPIYLFVMKYWADIYNDIVDYLEKHQKPSESELEKIKQYEAALNDWNEWHKGYEIEYAKYKSYLAKVDKADKAWQEEVFKIDRAHDLWEKRRDAARESWNQYVDNEYMKLEERRQRCAAEVDRRIPSDRCWSTEDFLGRISEINSISENAYINRPEPASLPSSGMVQLNTVSFFPEECVYMRKAMAEIQLAEAGLRQPNGSLPERLDEQRPALLDGRSANAVKNTKENATPSNGEDTVYVLTGNIKRDQGRRIEARLIVDGDGFLVLRGSTIALTEASSCPQSVSSIRKDPQYVKDGNVIRDVPFSSPSAAAGFVLGSSCNGWEKWKTSDGMTLREAHC